MGDELKIKAVDANYKFPLNNINSTFLNDGYLSIFPDAGININSVNETEENVELLEEQLNNIMEENGIFTSAWNEVKETVNIGTSAEKCNDVIESYQKGEITFEEAQEKINEFANKQETSLNLFSNIVTSFAAIAAGTAAAAAVIASGGTLAPVAAAALAGAGAGALTKSGFKFTDRATNKVKGDALDAKQIAKDGLSGAVTGAIAGATMGNGSASIGASAARCAKTGVITGGVSGSSNYIIDCTFDDDKDFSLKDLAYNTGANALVGGIVGGIMGAGNGVLRSNGVIQHGGMVKANNGVIQNATSQDIFANSVCSAEYKVLNDRIKAVA